MSIQMSEINCLLGNSEGHAGVHQSLQTAASNGDTEQLKYLIDTLSADVNAPDEHGDTPLIAAVNSGSLEATQALLARGAKVDIVNREGDSVLHVAAREDHSKIATFLFEKTDDIDGCNAYGEAAIHLAAIRGHMTIIEKLCELGANINQELDQSTALHLAIANKQVKTVIKLIEEGASLDKADSNGNVPLHLAAHMSFIDAELVKLLVKKNESMLVSVNKDGNTPLHVAAMGGHYKSVVFLLDHGSPVLLKNKEGDTPLHLAAHKGWAVTAEMIIAKDKSVINLTNNEMLVPLHKAIQNGKVKVVQMLLDVYKEDNNLWQEFLLRNEVPSKSVMDMALDNSHDKVALTLVQSPYWKTFMLEEKHCGGKKRCTPLRRLIKDMPNVARQVMDNCLEVNSKHIIVNCELVDDRYLNKKGDIIDSEILGKDDDEKAMIKADTMPYTTDVCVLKRNHPLTMIADREIKELIDHPLLQTLLRRKWALTAAIYLSFMAYYTVFIGLLIAFMIHAKPPMGRAVCANQDKPHTDQAQFMLAVFVYIFAILGMITEIVQMVLTKIKTYIELHNLCDWFTYIGPLLVVSRFTECGAMLEWQWHLGVSCVFVSCLNLLFFVRIIPFLGIYVMMVLLMLRNFMQFFIIMFLFILTFGISFFLLLQNQNAFSTPFFSIMKNWVMMIGEMDFTDTFHGHRDSDEENAQMHYEALTWILYIAFLVFLSLIVMNLLTSLAVCGIEGLQEDSKYRMMVLQIQLALNVELALPIWLQHRLHCVVKYQKLKIHRKRNKLWLWKRYQQLVYGNLCEEDIVKQALKVIGEREENGWGKAVVSKQITRKQMENVVTVKTKDMRMDIRDIDKNVENVEKRVKAMEQQVNKIHDMLVKMMETKC